jgi:integrase
MERHPGQDVRDCLHDLVDQVRVGTPTQRTDCALAALNRISGQFEVLTKGGKVMHGKIDPKALAYVRTYLRLRPERDSPALFLTDAGKAMSYDGGRMIWRCIQKRSGVKRLGSHLIRHSFGHGMARGGASIADIQEVLGHESDKMPWHYAGDAQVWRAHRLFQTSRLPCEPG